MRPGLQTTEFWAWAVTMLSSSIFSGIMLWAQRYDPWQELTIYIIKALVDVSTTTFYIWARSRLKHIEAQQ